MAYENLKSAIKQAIKQNGNQEITGNLLQSTLLSMADNMHEVVQSTGEANDKVMSQKATSVELGKKFDKANIAKESGSAEDKVMSQKAVSDKLSDLVMSLKAEFSYKGIAQPTTNPGVPDSNVFYIAGEGTYANFSNLVIEAGQLGILKWNGTWSKEVLEMGAGAGGGNMILDWNTDVETTRSQIPEKERKTGMILTYNHPDKGWVIEQHIYSATNGYYWTNDKYWTQLVTMKHFIDNNMVRLLEWNTGVKTTRSQIAEKERKPGLILIYNHPENGWVIEQYIYTQTNGYYWTDNKNWNQIIGKAEFSQRLNAFDKKIEVGGDRTYLISKTPGQMIDADGTITASDRGNFYLRKNLIARMKGLNDKLSFNVNADYTSYFCFHDIENNPIQTENGIRVLIENDRYYDIPSNAYYLYSESYTIKDCKYGLNAALINSAYLAQKNIKNITLDFADPKAPITGYNKAYTIFIGYDFKGYLDKIVIWCAANSTLELKKFKRIYTLEGTIEKAYYTDYLGSFNFENEGRNEIIFDEPLYLDNESIEIRAIKGGVKFGDSGNKAAISLTGAINQAALYEVYMKDNITAWNEILNQPKREIVKMGMPIFEDSSGRLSEKMYFFGNWKKSGSSVLTNCSSQSAYAKVSKTTTVSIKWSHGVIGYKINDGDYVISDDAGGTQQTISISNLDSTIDNYIEIKAIKNDTVVLIDDILVDEGGSVTPVKPKRRTIHYLGDSIIQGHSLTNSGLESFAYLVSKMLNCNIVTYAASGYRVDYNGVRTNLMKPDETVGFEKADIFVMALTTNGAGGSGDFDLEYSSILKWLKSVFPGTPLICLVPQNNSNRDKIKQLADDNKCLYMSAGVFGYENHPSAKGSKVIADYLYRKFVEMFGVDYFNPQ